MRWIVILGVLLGACGGPKIPMHSGYKNDKLKPWKKAKVLKWDDKNEAKTEGDLNYAEYKRAKWIQIDIPSHGTLTLKLEITPPGDAANEDFDLAMEVLDPGYRIIGKSDAEESDAGELTKTKTLLDLDPGHYLVHLYLQSRMDSADFVLRATFSPTKAAELKTDFPAQVAFLPQLPMVPINDEVPPGKRPPPPTQITRTVRQPKPPKPDPAKPAPVVSTGRIVGVSVVGNGTRITIVTNAQASGMKAQLKGISGAFPVECNGTVCAAVVAATPDQVRGAGGSVTLVP